MRQKNIVVLARDTDVLLLLLFHMDKITCYELWMNVGTSNKPKYIPVKKIYESLPKEWVKNILAFHALTGCDTTSFISGFSKKSWWKIFMANHYLLSGVVANILTYEIVQSVEKFICKAYKLPSDINTVSEACMVLFPTARKPEALPPTSEALHHHTKRAHFQTLVWINAHLPCTNLPDPTDFSWKLNEYGELVPVPIPDSCLELLACGCKTGCKTFIVFLSLMFITNLK